MQVVAVVTAVEVAVVVFVTATDSWSCFVDIAAVVTIEILAAGGDVDVPVAVFYEDGDALVGEVPADVVVITFGIGGFNGQGNIAAAKAGAFLTGGLSQDKLLYFRGLWRFSGCKTSL